MKRRWLLIALCSLIFGLFGAVASAWLPAMIFALSAAPAPTNRIALNGRPGMNGWAMVDELALGVTRARVLWSTGNSSEVGQALPDDAPGWALHQPGAPSTTTGYGWPMIGLRWGARGAFGSGIASISMSVTSTAAPSVRSSLSVNASFSISSSGNTITARPSSPSASTPAIDAKSISTNSVVIVPGANPPPNGPRNADILSPLRFSLFGASVVLPVYPYWPGFLVNTLVYGAIALLIIVLVARILHRRREHAGQCLTCGYDRRGLSPDAPCPECGQLAASPVDPVPIVASAAAESPPPTP